MKYAWALDFVQGLTFSLPFCIHGLWIVQKIWQNTVKFPVELAVNLTS